MVIVFENNLFIACISPFPQVLVPSDNVITVNEFLFDFHYFPEDDFLPLLVVGTVECALWRMD